MSTFKHLNDDQLDEIVQLATDFQVTNGSIKKTKDEEKGSGHSLIPFLLLPMPISGKHFELAKSLQTKYQVLSVYPTLFFSTIFFLLLPVQSRFSPKCHSTTLVYGIVLQVQSSRTN